MNEEELNNMSKMDLKRKIRYLFEQLQQLEAQNKKLEGVIAKNRETIQGALTFRETTDRATTKTNSVTNIQNGNNQLQSGVPTSNPKDTAGQVSLAIIMEKLNSENKILLDIIKDLSNERNLAQSKALIFEQISEMTEKHERINTRQLMNKLKAVMKTLREKDSILDQGMSERSEYVSKAERSPQI